MHNKKRLQWKWDTKSCPCDDIWGYRKDQVVAFKYKTFFTGSLSTVARAVDYNTREARFKSSYQ